MPPSLKAEALVQRGYSGFITGHTHRAELRRVGDGFYANTGCCDEILVERPARLGLPPVFAAEQERTWLELEVGDEPRLRLYHTRTAQPAERPLERLASRRRAEPPAEPVLVAEYPFGPSWPQQDAGRRRLRRFRYRALRSDGLVGGERGEFYFRILTVAEVDDFRSLPFLAHDMTEEGKDRGTHALRIVDERPVAAVWQENDALPSSSPAASPPAPSDKTDRESPTETYQRRNVGAAARADDSLPASPSTVGPGVARKRRRIALLSPGVEPAPCPVEPPRCETPACAKKNEANRKKGI